jgi:predicted Zn-dependent protease
MLALLSVLLCVGTGWAALHFYVDHHLRAAEQATAAYDFDAAERHLAACLWLLPRSVALHFEMARTARRANHYDEASEHLQKCRDLQPRNPDHALEAILLRVQRGDIAKEERLLQAEVDHDNPDAALILEALAKGYMQTYRLDAEMYCLNRLLDREPDHVIALLLRASLWKTAGNQTKAENDFRRAVESQPEHREARRQYGEHLLLTKQPEEALRQFEYLRQRPGGDDVDILLDLARSHRQLGDAQTARQLLDDVLARNPHEGFALIERGKIALEIESPATAETWLRQAVADYPFDAQANYLLAQALEKQGKDEEARRYDAARIRIEGDLKALEEAFHRVVKEPRAPEPRLQAGRICLRNGRADEGERWLLSALELVPEHAATRAALAEYYARIGKEDLAKVYRRPIGDRDDKPSGWLLPAKEP